MRKTSTNVFTLLTTAIPMAGALMALTASHASVMLDTLDVDAALR